MRQLLLGAMIALSVAACSGASPVAGETADGEHFSGTFTRRMNGLGSSVALKSDRGASCEGQWQLDEQSTGSVVILCKDGRTGTAELSAQEGKGTMKGMLGGLPFKGNFEDPSRPAS
jgi:hypothetical protein